MKYKTFAYGLIFFLLFAGMPISKNECIKNSENYDSNIAVHLKSSANSERIYINNNWTETKTAGICTGDGTESNPYSLKNLIIDAGGIGTAIHIENTTEHFKIENCTLSNSGGTIHDAGIQLENVKNGQFINNTTFDNYFGMLFFSSLNLLLVRNRFYNLNGIKLINTNDSLFYLNTFISTIGDVTIQWSSNQYNSRKMYSYTYNGSTFTNYLGNYWSDYDEPDGDGDGLGDTAFRVDPFVVTNPRLRDYYPLIAPIDAYSNITIVEDSMDAIPGFNMTTFLGIIGIITILIVMTNRNKGKMFKD